MKVVRPISFTPAMLVSTSAVESVAAYNAATTYAVGNRVTYLQGIYESLQATNTGHTPSTSPTWWLYVAPTNQYAMFDGEVNTQTTAAGGLSVVVQPGMVFDSIALLNVSGSSVTVNITNGAGGPVVYNKTVNLDASASLVVDWYDYFFEPFQLRTDVVLTDIPPYVNARVSITVVSGGAAACGLFLAGTAATLGETQRGVGVGIRDYSTKETDAFGVTTFVQRAFSKRMRPAVFCENSALNAIFRALSDLRAKPTVWIGSQIPGYEPLIIFGFIKDWNIEIPYPHHSLLSMEVEGLI